MPEAEVLQDSLREKKGRTQPADITNGMLKKKKKKKDLVGNIKNGDFHIKIP